MITRSLGGGQALTRNRYGDGSLTYVGSWPSQALLLRIAADVLQSAGVNGIERNLPDRVRVKSGVNRHGRLVRSYLELLARPAAFLLWTFRCCEPD